MTGLPYLAPTRRAAGVLLGKKARNRGWKLWSRPAWAGSRDCSCSKPVTNVGGKKTKKSITAACVCGSVLPGAGHEAFTVFDLAQSASSAECSLASGDSGIPKEFGVFPSYYHDSGTPEGPAGLQESLDVL